MISCCRYCVPPDRYPGCHDHCEKYQKQKAEHDRIKEEEKVVRRREDDITKYDVDRNIKRMKRKQK